MRLKERFHEWLDGHPRLKHEWWTMFTHDGWEAWMDQHHSKRNEPRSQ